MNKDNNNNNNIKRPLENKKINKPNNNLKIPNIINNLNENCQNEIHYYFTCDGCKMNPIIGKRYKCKICTNFDYCENCYQKNILTHRHEFILFEKSKYKKPIFLEDPKFFNHSFGHSFPKNIVYELKQKKIIHKKIEYSPTNANLKIHFGIECDGCGVYPIVGCRYKCKVCDNFDYCEKCKMKFSQKHRHPFLLFE